jgi:sugar lactone lactonase YvrE
MNRRSLKPALVATLLIATAAMAASVARAAGDDISSLTRIQLAAKAAHDGKDYVAYRARIQQLYDLLSGEPGTLFAMAKAEALLGHSAPALDWLNAFAATGLRRDAAAEPDLASLAKAPGFGEALARLAANKRPIAHAVQAFVLPDGGLLSEDIAYDGARHRFLVSSVREGKIVAVDAKTGAMSDFVPSGRDAVWGLVALAADQARGALWATTAAMPQTLGYKAADAGHTAVLRYDLASGKLLQRYDLPVGKNAAPTAATASPATEPAAEERVLGDMTVGANGDVFVAEGLGGAVYVLRHGGASLETLVPEGTFLSPQTPAVTRDGKRLLVADYTRGIGVVDLATGAVSFLPHPREVVVHGIDGMYLYGDSLLAMQNGTDPNRVIRLYLDDAGTRILRGEILESGSRGLGVPTHGTLVDGTLYFLANSGWDQLDDDGALKPGGVLTSPMIWRVAL